jgi:aminomethyltransferase
VAGRLSRDAGELETPLLALHRELGARLIRFAGWLMPVHYAGTISEHNAVRTSVGVFDVSHLGKLRVAGPSAGAALQQALTADVESLQPGRAAYGLALGDDGGCIDDLFVYRIGDEEWLVVPNAANVAAVGEAIEASGATVADERERWAILAVQGPDSFRLFDEAFPRARASELPLHAWRELDVLGEPGMVARTGYTGERGFELYAPAGRARAAFEHLLALGATPVGLGARDTLRLEMGYALYGHELTRELNPLEAGLGWALAWDTPFRGRAALERVRQRGPARKLVGIRLRGRGVPRQGCAVFRDQTRVAEVTSGNYSPTLGTGIALALGSVQALPEAGASVDVDARGRRIEGIIVKPPFIERGRQP